MRISPSTILWLAAASSVGMVTAEDSITFNNSDFTTGQNGAAVFVAVGIQQTHQFHWSATQSVAIAIKDVNLRADDLTLVGSFSPNSTSTTGSDPSHTTTLSTTTGDGGGVLGPATTQAQNMRGHGIVPIIPVLGGEWRSGGEKRSGEIASTAAVSVLPGVVSMTEAPDRLSGIIYITNLAQLGGSQFASKKLWLELVWDAPDGQHTVYSRAFTVTTAAKGDAGTLALDPAYSNPSAVQPESVASGGSGNGITTTVAGATSTSSTVASATAVEPMGGSGTQSGHSSSGLSTGAIAGIAVAAALIGLALLAALIFCLIRRRRRNAPLTKTDLAPGGYGNRTPELIAQKEANAGVGVEVSPHSPYSDDGGGGMSVPTAGRGLLHHGTARQEEMPLAGYADRPVSNREMADGESLGGSQTGRITPGRSTPTAVRHLVEEGMTEDEIRRLEEEERELDQAIEQAGGGRR